jgi:hypothetical protein
LGRRRLRRCGGLKNVTDTGKKAVEEVHREYALVDFIVERCMSIAMCIS